MPITTDEELDEALSYLEDPATTGPERESLMRAVQAYNTARTSPLSADPAAPTGIDAIELGQETLRPFGHARNAIPREITPNRAMVQEVEVDPYAPVQAYPGSRGVHPAPMRRPLPSPGMELATVGAGIPGGLIPGATELIEAGVGEISPEAGAEMRQFRREHQGLSDAGTAIGAVTPWGLESTIARGIGMGIPKLLPRAAAVAPTAVRAGSAALGAGTAAATGGAMRDAAAQFSEGGLEAVTPPSAEDLASRFLVGSALGGGFDIAGAAAGSLARSNRSSGKLGPEIERFERAGGKLGVSGPKPSADMRKVQTEVERRAREEGRVMSPTDVALERVEEPMARAALRRQTDTANAARAETEAYNKAAGDVPLETENLLRSGVEELRARSFADGGPLPAQRPSTEQIRKAIVKPLAEPEIVPAAQADEMGKAGAIVMTPEELERIGLSAKDLAPRARVRPEPAAAPVTAESILGQQTGPQLGSNPGGTYRGMDGVNRYVKFYPDPAQASTEKLANRLYNDLGIDAPTSVTFDQGGRRAIASEIVPDLQPLPEQLTPEAAASVLGGFPADILTANWDVVGGAMQNLGVSNGRLMRMDNGSAFLFRGRQGRKVDSVLDDVTELHRFLKDNPEYSAVAQAAGITEPEQLIPVLQEGVRRARQVEQQAGGWANYVEQHAPELASADKARVAQMLTARTAKLEDATARMGFEPLEQEAGAFLNSHRNVAELRAFLNVERARASAAQGAGQASPVGDAAQAALQDAQAAGLGYQGVVYRGARLPPDVLAKLQPGAPFPSDRIWSTTSYRPTAEAHALRRGADEGGARVTIGPGGRRIVEGGGAPFKQGVVLEIEGSNAVPVSGMTGQDTFEEMLTPMGQPFKVVSVDSSGKVPTVRLRADAPPGAPVGETTEEARKIVLRSRQLNPREVDRVAGDIDAARKVEQATSRSYDPFYDTAAREIRNIRDTAPMVPGVADENTVVKGYDAEGNVDVRRGLSGLKGRQAARQEELEADLVGAGLPKQLPAGRTVIPEDPNAPLGANVDPVPALDPETQQPKFRQTILNYERGAGGEVTRDEPLRKLAAAAKVTKELNEIPGLTAWQNLAGRAATGKAVHGVVSGAGPTGYVTSGAGDFLRLRLDPISDALGGVPATLSDTGARRALAQQLSPGLIRLLRSMRAGATTATGKPGGFGTQVLGLRGGPAGARVAATLTDEDIENLRSLVSAQQPTEEMTE